MGRAEAVLLAWLGERDGDEALLERVRREVAAALGCPARLTRLGAPPPETLDPRRGQRSSTKILRWLLEHPFGEADKLIGITDADLFIPVLTFVFGEAQVGGSAGVVSLARLRETFDGRPASPALVELRLLKECLHELGHTFGLVHCARPGCVMTRSNTILDVDGKLAGFCRECRIRLRERGGTE